MELGCSFDILILVAIYTDSSIYLNSLQYSSITCLLNQHIKTLARQMAESSHSLMKQLKSKDDSSLKIITDFFKDFEISLCCSKIL